MSTVEELDSREAYTVSVDHWAQPGIAKVHTVLTVQYYLAPGSNRIALCGPSIDLRWKGDVRVNAGFRDAYVFFFLLIGEAGRKVSNRKMWLHSLAFWNSCFKKKKVLSHTVREVPQRPRESHSPAISWRWRRAVAGTQLSLTSR